MPTLFRTQRVSDDGSGGSERPTIDLREIRLPEVILPEVKLPHLNVPDIEVPKVDVGKTMLNVATAAGLVDKRRSRWPYVIGGVVVVGVAAWALMNTAIRTRLAGAVTTVGERVRAMRAGGQDQEPVAFPAAHTAPITEPAYLSVPPSPDPDYPEGLGAENETRSTTGSSAENGHRTTTAPR